jgi:hypothetical protein
MAQPKILTPGNERLRQIRDLVEDEEPIGSRHDRIEFACDDSGRDIVHDHEAVKRIWMIFGEARRDTGPPIMPDQRDLWDFERPHQFAQVSSHVALVVPCGWFVRLAVSSQIGSDNPIFLGQLGDLMPPSVASLGKTMEQNDRHPLPRLHIVLADIVGVDRVMLDLSHDGVFS